MDREMQRALEADGQKLRDLTSEDHGPFYDDDLADGCDHDDYDADILTGRATCHRCGHAWWQTKEDLEREQRHAAEYAIWVEEQERRERWEWIARPWRWLKYRALMPFSPRRAVRQLNDDEIPF